MPVSSASATRQMRAHVAASRSRRPGRTACRWRRDHLVLGRRSGTPAPPGRRFPRSAAHRRRRRRSAPSARSSSAPQLRAQALRRRSSTRGAARHGVLHVALDLVDRARVDHRADLRAGVASPGRPAAPRRAPPACRRSASCTPRCTNTRFGQTQVWPPLRNLAAIRPSTAASRSASSNTMKGALPPSSSDSFLSVSADSPRQVLAHRRRAGEGDLAHARHRPARRRPPRACARARRSRC